MAVKGGAWTVGVAQKRQTGGAIGCVSRACISFFSLSQPKIDGQSPVAQLEALRGKGPAESSSRAGLIKSKPCMGEFVRLAWEIVAKADIRTVAVCTYAILTNEQRYTAHPLRLFPLASIQNYCITPLFFLIY